MTRQDNGTNEDAPPFPPGFFPNPDDTSLIDITDNLQELIDFFQTDDFDTSDIDDILQWFEDLDFIEFDGTVWSEEEEIAGKLDKRQLLAREARQLLQRRIIQKRGWGLFEGMYNGAKALYKVNILSLEYPPARRLTRFDTRKFPTSSQALRVRS